MPSVDASAIAHSTSVGGQLVFDFIIYDASGATINNPALVAGINIFSGTQAVDGLSTLGVTLTGTDLVNSSGNLINTYTVSGYTTLATYFTEFTVTLVDYSTTTLDLTNTIYGGINQILPVITAIPKDDYVLYTFDASSAAQMTSQMGYAGLPYDHMYAAIRINDGSGGFVRYRFPWAEVVATHDASGTYTVIVDQSNGVAYEAYGQYLSDQPFLIGVSKTSAALITTATNKPNIPVQVATISTFEYNTYNAGSIYTVQDASSTSVLFNAPVGQDPNTVFYTIYKYDLSNNGYSTPVFDASFNVYVDVSGVYTYKDSNGSPLTYQYRYIDTNVVAGKFYAYAISGTNDHGEGLLTSQYGVREGQQCKAPSITTVPGNNQVTVNITAPAGITGGFDFSNNGYTIAYTPLGGSTQYATGLQSGSNIITGLTNDVSYTFTAYAETTNTNYTTVGTTVSSSNTGPLLTYLSAVSNSSTIVPYAPPPAPTQVATISSFEYNRYNAGTIYTVPDASSVSILFNTPSTQDASAVITSYTIYKYDLSSNGYSNPVFDASFNISADASGSYTYTNSAGNPLVYKYRYIDTAVAAGNFYGYAISSTNIYATGTASSQYGVREGQKCTPDSITGEAGNAQVTITITQPAGSLGGFDLSNNGYTIAYTDVTNSGATQYITGLLSGNYTVTGLTNGVTYSFSAYAETTNRNYTTVGTDVSSNNLGPLLTYSSAISNTLTLTPNRPPPVPTNVVAALDYSANVPDGYVDVHWDASATFEGSTVYFQYLRSDLSGVTGWVENGTSTSFQDITTNPTDLGTSIFYYVRSYIIANNNNVYSNTVQSNSVTPYVPPNAPTFSSTGVSGLKVYFSLNPSTQSGGLVPVHYNAVLTSDASGNVPIPGAAPFNDISANVTYYSNDLSANLTVYVKAAAYVNGQDQSGNPIQYFSSSVIQLAGLTLALPVVTNVFIDSSGILHFTTNNNGSALNFAEALIVDASAQLNLSVNTNPVVGTSGFMTVVSNTTAGSVITVNFNDPNISRPQPFNIGSLPYSPSNTLIVVCNAVGASVFDTLQTIP